MQCSIKDNGIEVPSFLHLKTNKSLSNITFTEKDIEKVIQSLDSNKAHRNDMISINMLKMWQIYNKAFPNHLQNIFFSNRNNKKITDHKKKQKEKA